LLRKDFDKENKFIYDIVSNTICADLIDYIQRDAYFTGATGLHFKFDDRILKYMTLEYDQKGYLRLVFKPIKDKIRIDVITDIIQLLRYRYMITERVTFHHTRCAANAMLIKAIQLLGTSDEDFFYSLGDDDVLYLLSHSKDENVREIAEMLKNRELFKIVFRVTSSTAPGLKEGSVSLVSQKYGEKDGREELEDRLISEITKIPGLNNFEKNHIAIYCPPDEHMNFKETKVLVRWRSDIPTPLSDIEPWHNWERLIKDEVEALEEKYKALWNMHIFVHPKFKRHLYVIEKCCESVLGVKNDPLLERSFGRSEDYRDYNEYATMLARKETEIVTIARQIERGELSFRGLPTSAGGVKMNREEALNEAIRQVIPPVEKEEEELNYEDKDLRDKKKLKKK
jgi:HD superfamily phosphohydrolase